MLNNLVLSILNSARYETSTVWKNDLLKTAKSDDYQYKSGIFCMDPCQVIGMVLTCCTLHVAAAVRM